VIAALGKRKGVHPTIAMAHGFSGVQIVSRVFSIRCLAQWELDGASATMAWLVSSFTPPGSPKHLVDRRSKRLFG